MASEHLPPSGQQRRPGRGVAAPASSHVNVPTPSGDVVLVDPLVHRADVVRRLLAMGVSVRTLLTLLPDWEGLIRAVIAEEAATRAPSPAPINRPGPSPDRLG